MIVLAIITTAATEERATAKQARGENSQAQATASSKTTTLNRGESAEQQRLNFEREKYSNDLILQKEELELKRNQLKLEGSQRVWTALSTVIPLLAVLFTILYNALIFRRQTKQQDEQRREDTLESRKQREEDANIEFQLKAAEIAFKGETALAVQDRAKALKRIFPSRLSDEFLVDYDPFEFGEREGNLESKKFFLELLLKYPNPEQQFETLSFWKEIFPGDVEWLRRVNLSPHTPPNQRMSLRAANETVGDIQTPRKEPST